ncbi:2'-5' RNA ligase family protein [Nocardia takedensis]
MRKAPTAIGYLRKDVSGVHQQWDETRIRSHARRLGYELAKTVTFSTATDDPEARLINVVRSLEIDAVIAPSLDHFGGAVPEILVRSVELNVLAPRPATYARRHDTLAFAPIRPKRPFPPTVPVRDEAHEIRDNDWVAFRAVRELADHWSVKAWTPGQSVYYWYLTFDDPAVVALAERCQRAVAAPTVDAVPPDGLHLSVLRVGATTTVPPRAAAQVLAAGQARSAELAAFDLEVGPLTGSRSALRFSVAPWAPVRALHRTLREVTGPVGGELADTDDLRPHLGVGYLNTAGPAARLIESVAAVRDDPPVTTRVRAVDLVEVRREGRAYRWDVLGRVPLDG